MGNRVPSIPRIATDVRHLLCGYRSSPRFVHCTPFGVRLLAMDLNVLWWDLERLERELRHAYTRDRPQDPYGLLDRVGNVRTALRQSTSIAAQSLVTRLAGIDVSGVLGILLDACKDIALYWGGSILLGGAAGAGIGAIFGGIGAIPGAFAGAAFGAQAGAWILGMLGLASLVEGLGTALGDALVCYGSGIQNAWGPTEEHPHRHPARAPYDLARGHELMAVAILTAIAVYLSRGRGDKKKLLHEIRQSPRLGPKVADWVEANEGRLVTHSALRPNANGHLAAIAPARKPDTGPAMTPSQLRRSREEPPPEPAPKPQAPRLMPQKKVRCFEPNGLPSGSFPEFDRQLAGQERGLNDMTVDEYLKGREAFDPANRDAKVARDARAEYRARTVKVLTESLRKEGVGAKDAAVQAAQIADTRMKTLAALHNPDMVAGGKDVIADFGDRNINSRIGAQWKTQGRVASLDEAARSISPADRGAMKMNAKLTRCT